MMYPRAAVHSGNHYSHLYVPGYNLAWADPDVQKSVKKRGERLWQRMPVELAGRQGEDCQAKKLQQEWKGVEIVSIDPFEMTKRRRIF